MGYSLLAGLATFDLKKNIFLTSASPTYDIPDKHFIPDKHTPDQHFCISVISRM